VRRAVVTGTGLSLPSVSFNSGASLDTGQVQSGGGGGRLSGGMLPIGGGIGGVLVLVIYIAFQALTGGVSSTDGGASGIDGSTGTGSSPDFSSCRTGADANRDVTCRVIGTVNSVQAYWASALPAYGKTYSQAQTVIYSGQTQSACGTASNAVGPFYCPTDKKVYIDTSFFAELTTRFGADSGALAQEYVVAHEYGHHIQDILGLIGRAQAGAQGATGGSVRTELQADCLAGVWANHAATTKDANGQTLLEPLSRSDITSALSAASAVGDDRIQKQATGHIDQDTWTHGSSAERQRWFTTGYTTGSLSDCDTFSAKSL
jgi:predicted metalloprotease